MSWLARPARVARRIVHATQHVFGIRAPAVLRRVVAQELGEIALRQIALAEHVFGHAGVVERHVVTGHVVDDELHHRAGGPVVAGVGLFALVSFIVAGRRRQFGIRLALGSEPPRLFREALTGPVRLAGIGVGCGIVVAVLVVRAAGSQVFGLNTAGASAYVAAALLVLIISVGAAWFPARRATPGS